MPDMPVTMLEKSALEQLEAQIHELLLAYQHLKLENSQLRKKESTFLSEYQQLLSKNQTAAEKIRQILERLQAMEK